MSKEKTSKAALWRQYGLERPAKPRYTSNERKSILWVFMSMYVRIRDWRKYGTCISCGAVIEHWRDGDAGHYAPAQGCGVLLLFDPLNINLECKRCNGFDEGHLIGYRRGLIDREGELQVQALEELYRLHQKNPGAQKEFTQGEYHLKIVNLKTLMEMENML